MLEGVKFEFTCEDGTEVMTMAEYDKRDDLRSIFGRQARPPEGRQTLFLGKQIYSFPFSLLAEDPKRNKAFEEAEKLYFDNPLKYFCPQSQEALDFLNYRHDNLEGTFKVLHAGIGTGKTVVVTIDWLLSIIPCNPDWPIFKDFGVKPRSYRGPLTDGGVAVVSYFRSSHENTIWPQVISRWCPRKHIEPYLTGKKKITWRQNPRLVIADTPIFFPVSSQSDAIFTSQALDILHWDEQSTEDKFNNANGRVRRRGGRHVQSCTPHSLEGRADTGAGSYLDRIRKGEIDTGCDVKFFQMSMMKVADWVVPKEDKEAYIREWEEGPMETNNMKKLAEGRAILYGEFHERSGLVFDNFIPEYHVIEPFEVPANWTFYRYHDHGRKEANAAFLVAVNESNDKFIIAEYYGVEGDEIGTNARKIIEDMTGNEIRENEPFPPQEIATSRRVLRTVSDPRSLSKSLDNVRWTIRQEYMRHGLVLVPGSAQRPENMIPVAGQLLELDMNRKHFITKEPGAPQVYVFSTCKNFIWEITSWRNKVVRTVVGKDVMSKEKPEAKNDHLMQGFMMMGVDDPKYIPNDILLDRSEEEEEGIHVERYCDPLTGY